MGVAPNSPVSSSNTNSSFLDANADDVALGKIGLGNTDPVSGTSISNAQMEHNSVASFVGKAVNTLKTDLPSWTNNDVGSSTDNLVQRSDELTKKFNEILGHRHTGTAGDAPAIAAFDIASVPLLGVFVAGLDKSAVTGSSIDVSSEFAAQTPSNSSSTQGVVVNSPYNKTFIRNSSDDKIFDGLGNEVFGRLSESSGTWTLSFFSLVSGTETAYSFAIATDLKWFYQKLFKRIVDAPVYSELVSVQSENATADILDASETVAGKVLLASSAAQSVGSSNAKGSSTRAAKEDHAHQGVHSVFKTGDSNVYGDVEIAAGSNLTITRTGSKFQFDVTGSAVGKHNVPSNPVNGVNTIFGPTPDTLASDDSIVVFIDGVLVSRDQYSVASNTVTFTTAPSTGQKVEFWYLTLGAGVVPPAPSGTLKTEFRTITAGEASAKTVVLVGTPATPSEILLDVIGGGSGFFNSDYTVVGNELRWNGYGLDGILTTGDKIRVHYLT
jgi:hypothetical protein